MRAGRITASKFKAAARTDPANPVPSLIKQICYPESYRFSTAATEDLYSVDWNSVFMKSHSLEEDRWRCKHETVAKNLYEKETSTKHTGFKVGNSGLHISPAHPHLGASPDGMVQCDCCGKGLVEIKCPYCKHQMSVEKAASNKTFCLEKLDGVLSLRKDHVYYFQVQAQLHLINGVTYCDFVLWTEAEKIPFVQRIYKDSEFFQNALTNVTLFFKLGVLPELLGKWYTRSEQRKVTEPSPSNSNTQSNLPSVCFCKMPEMGIVLKCQSGFCAIQTFHLACLGLKNLPKRKWLCPNCRKLKSVSKGKK